MNSLLSYKIDYVILMKSFLNPEGHENRIIGHFTKGVDFAYWWSCIKKCLRLMPAQQACLNLFLSFKLKVNIYLDTNVLIAFFGVTDNTFYNFTTNIFIYHTEMDILVEIPLSNKMYNC